MNSLKVVIVVGVMSSAVTAFAQGGMGSHGMGQGSQHGMQRGMMAEHRGECMEKLNLTAEQKEKIAALHKEFEASKGKKPADRSERIKIRDERRAKIDAVLTPEQRKRRAEEYKKHQAECDK